MTSNLKKNSLSQFSKELEKEPVNMDNLVGILNKGEILNGSNNINLKDNYGWNFLMLATNKGRFGIVKLLLDNGATIDDKDNTGTTSLMLASYLGYFDIVNLLLERGANVNLQNNIGETALMRASLGKHLHVVDLLLSRGAYVGFQDIYGNNALHYACKQKIGVSNIPIINKLLEYGTDPNVINKNNKKPIDNFQGTENEKKEIEQLITNSIILHGVYLIDSSISEKNNPFGVTVSNGYENFENLKKYMGGKSKKIKRRTTNKKYKRRTTNKKYKRRTTNKKYKIINI